MHLVGMHTILDYMPTFSAVNYKVAKFHNFMVILQPRTNKELIKCMSVCNNFYKKTLTVFFCFVPVVFLYYE